MGDIQHRHSLPTIATYYSSFITWTQNKLVDFELAVAFFNFVYQIDTGKNRGINIVMLSWHFDTL